MTLRTRSISGALIAALTIPAILGLMACLPVPIGNPERSRIDPQLSGMWAHVNGEWGVTLFEPYDKRTWLVTSVEVGRDPDHDDDCGEGPKVDDYAGLIAWIEEHGKSCLEGQNAIVYKAWRSKQGKHWYLTMELKGQVPHEEGKDMFDEEFWVVYRIDKGSDDTFSLRGIDGEFDGFEGVRETRWAYEKVIRKNGDNDDLYVDDVTSFVRVEDEHIDLFADYIEDLMSFE